MTINSAWADTQSFFKKQWKKFLKLKRWAQVVIGIGVLVLLAAILVLARGGSTDSAATTKPTVTVQRIDAFGGSSNGVSVLGTVQSVSEADILAQSGGTVQSIHTSIGKTVPAGFVIADLDSAAASAAVLQAQGGYDAALAAQKTATLQANNSIGSFAETQSSARDSYRSTYTSLQNTLTNNVGLFFGNNTPVGPALLINQLTTGDTLPRERRDITTLMNAWQASLATANTADPLVLLSTAQSNLNTVSAFLSDLANLANTQGSGATAAQLAGLAAAQSSVNTLLASISSTRTAYNTAATAAAVGQNQTNAADGVTSAEANVEQALGSLRSAQAAYEKTVVRAPIGGTINFLPIHVGDNVNISEHVATVARNNALEVVMELSQNDANRLAVGNTVTVGDTYKGIVTTISPALNPTTKQIEVHVAVNDGADLINGQSVQVALPTVGMTAGAKSASSTSATTTARTGTVELPLTAVKLLPNERDVFTVENGRIVAHPVEIGDVIGDRIIIISPLDPSLEIVTDARGLSSGDAVSISTTPATK